VSEIELPIFSNGEFFCAFKLNLTFFNHSVAHFNYLLLKTYFKRIFLRLVQIKFRLFTVIFIHNYCASNNLVKYMQINYDNSSEMFSLSLSLYPQYYSEACNEFAVLISM